MHMCMLWYCICYVPIKNSNDLCARCTSPCIW